MIIGRVVGNAIASQKHPKYEGSKLLLVQPLDLAGEPEGEPLLAVDSCGAGVGERVLVVVEGRSASQAMRLTQAPANAAIVAIIDRIDRDEGALVGSKPRE